ncbi:MAG: glycosyltransferase [Geobacter sp.]|nr:MAG: glycosyltransferase [Geobacter sp.]
MSSLTPKVSICCITYNHADYISEAIEGFLKQKTDFDYEIIIHDDCSTDNTQKIINLYYENNKDKIKRIFQHENIKSKGKAVFPITFEKAKGKYIALCEGDDFWTDPFKLQKQVDLLDANPEYPFCFHPIYWLEQESKKVHKTYYGAPGIKEYYTLDELLEYSNFIPTASVVFRNRSFKELPEWYFNCPIGDYAFHLINLCFTQKNTFGFINDFMAVYRRHACGMHGGNSLTYNRERLLEAYLIIGKNLGLKNRKSWRAGFTKWMLELENIYKNEKSLLSPEIVSNNQYSKNILLINGYRVNSPALPVGLGYIAQALEDAGIDYDICDVNIQTHSQIAGVIKENKSRYVGIGTMTYDVDKNYQLLHQIKSLFPDISIVLGGPHAIAAGSDIFQECAAIDVVIQGEGEESLVKMVQGVPLQSIPGVLARNPGNNGPTRKLLEIETISFPKYHKFDLDKYGSTMNIASSRGCVYTCTFCGAPKFLGNKWRAFSATRMIEEFEYWHTKGYRNFYFSDSLFALDKQRVVDFCNHIASRNYNDVVFTADGARADHLTPEILQQLKIANFSTLIFGVESVHNSTLDFFQKNETFTQIDNTISAADALGFNILIYLIIGAPGESYSEALESIRYPLRYKNISNAIVSKLMPIKGTSYYQYALEHGLVENPDLCYPTHEVSGFNSRTDSHNPVEKIWAELNPEIKKLSIFLKTRNEARTQLKDQGIHSFSVEQLNTLTQHHIDSTPVEGAEVKFNSEHTVSSLNKQRDPLDLISRLLAVNVPVTKIILNVDNFISWLSEYREIHDRYCSSNDVFIEKCLEHYIAHKLTELKPGQVYIDIAAAGSNWTDCLLQRGINAYSLDLSYPEGIHGNIIGANAAETPLPENSVNAMSLQCAFETFEGDNDKLFIRESKRILKESGKVVISPLYLDTRHFILSSKNTDLSRVPLDEGALRICREDEYTETFSRHYSPEALAKRIFSNLDGLSAKVFYIDNLDEFRVRFPGQRIYCDFNLYLEKPCSASKNQLLLSVIIPTRNRAALLYNALESITKQTFPATRFEVIIVDNGSTDATAEVCQHFKQRIPNLNYISAPLPGLHNGRHAGLKESIGEILVYADDDIEAMPTWLEAIASSFRDPMVALVGGKILPKFENQPPEWVAALGKKTDSGWSLGWYSILDFGDTEHEIPHEYVWGCNFSIRKNVLQQVGGFHPDSFPQEFIKYRGDGETAVSQAIRNLGLKAFYNPKASVYHVVSQNRLTQEYIYQRAHNQGISDSYASIRTARLFSDEMQYKSPTNTIHDVVDRGYVDGFNFHQQLGKSDQTLLNWILKESYINCEDVSL